MAEINDEVHLVQEEFVDAMNRRLTEHAWKGGWSECSVPHLLAGAMRKLAQIAVVTDYEHNSELEWDPPVDTIQELCADLANYAMMIADVS